MVKTCLSWSRWLALFGLIIAVLDITIESIIYSSFVNYEPSTMCCGLIYDGQGNNDDGILSPPYDIHSLDKYGLTINNDNICLIQNVTCDKWNNGFDDLDDCLYLSGYDWNVKDLCNQETMLKAFEAYTNQLSWFFIAAMIGIIINAIMDIFELFCPDSENCMKVALEWIAYFSICCCFPCCRPKNEKTRKKLAFWFIQFLFWGFALTLNYVTSSVECICFINFNKIRGYNLYKYFIIF